MASSGSLQSMRCETYTTNIMWVECDKYPKGSIKNIMSSQWRRNVLPSGSGKAS